MKRRSFILIAAAACASPIALSSSHLARAAHPANTTREYVVKAGDTLLGIALSFDVSMAAIQSLNDLADPSLIRVGQTLKIPAGKSQPDESALWPLYIVQPGDTLSTIATRHSVKVVDLARVNGIGDASAIQVGQKLIIPLTGRPAQSAGAQAALSVEAQSPAPAPTPELIPLAPIAAPEPAAPPPEPAPTAIPLPVLSPQEIAASANANASVEIEATRARLLALYNQVRVAKGIHPLAYSFVLQAAAQGHADDCATRGSGSHFGSDGSRSSQRIARAGFGGRITGENWAWARSADQAFDMWYTREIPNGPHLLNIMSPRYTEVGFGIAPSRGGYYMIANFGG